MEVRSNINLYLAESEVIDFNSDEVRKLASELKLDSANQIELIKNTYEYVRDSIDHSADINGSVVTCKASEVLIHREGICYAKSHLLSALLRANHIPCGFCYQKLLLDDIEAPFLILHGLNAVFIGELNKWIRIDARGNKQGVDAAFSLDKEQLAFEVREEFGEKDIDVIFDKPDASIIKSLNRYSTVEELFDNLPEELTNSSLLEARDE